MDQQAAQNFIDEIWDNSIVPELVEYIKLPAKSPHFDADWKENGYLEEAVQMIFGCARHKPWKVWNWKLSAWKDAPL